LTIGDGWEKPMKINWKLTLCVLCFLTPASRLLTQEVEHAPTVAQCQADQALWMAKLQRDHGTDDVTVKALWAWEHEMGQCMDVDRPNHSKYYNTEGEATAQESLREMDFIVRAGLRDQFFAEDAAGKR
jgi:hypothetical protein